ncbi:MAG: hypothetical protein AAF431_09420 [Pseudomonadota bacterium]
MSTQIKYLVFKGISKKEEILFKSFLNLAKNELPYQVVVLKANRVDQNDPDLVILDEDYELENDELKLSDLPTILVGDDHRKQQPCYVTRPVQWSEFKAALSELDVELKSQGENAERVLPSDVKFAIAEMGNTVSVDDSAPTDDKKEYSDEGEYEYELDKMSVDYHSFTNSDYVKVVDDVMQFKDAENAEGDQPVILMTDDESASVNSVLVLETHSVDAWDFEDSEFSISEIVNEQKEAFEEPESDLVVLKQRAGFEIAAGEEYWLEDNEIIVDNDSFLFIKPARKMVYSSQEPGKWPTVLQKNKLTRVPLREDWRPRDGLKVYPISRLLWVNTLISQTRELAAGLDEDQEYLLERWPHFDLLEMDNVLLKLCTMLFVRPESVSSLASKSGYGRSTICGLMNACHEMGYLKQPDQIGAERLAHAAQDEGMLGKIKDVFR